MRGPIVPHAGFPDKQRLEKIVRRKLRSRHQHRAETIWPYSAKQRARAFFPRHADQAVESIFVIATLRGRKGRVVLHANVDYVGRVAGNAAEESGRRGH